MEAPVSLIRKVAHTLYQWWMAFARFLGAVNAAILLTVVYAVLIGFMSLIVRGMRKDLLGHRAWRSNTSWKDRERLPDTVEQARHQF